MEKTEVKVVGVGSRKVQTTIAVVWLCIEKRGETAAAALKVLAESVDSLVDYLKKENVDKLEIFGVIFREHRDGPQNPAQPVKNLNTDNNSEATTECEVTKMVTFEVAVDKCGSIFDGAVEAGATRIDRISFKAAPQVDAEARENAIVDAVNDAKREANIAAVAAVLTLGKATKIQITGTHPPSAKGSPGATAPTTVKLQQYSVSARVSVTFEAE